MDKLSTSTMMLYRGDRGKLSQCLYQVLNQKPNNTHAFFSFVCWFEILINIRWKHVNTIKSQ